MIRILSINVNGFKNKTKRQNAFRWFEKKHFDIILLQETHCNDNETESDWIKIKIRNEIL